jgi:hypothetical protein
LVTIALHRLATRLTPYWSKIVSSVALREYLVPMCTENAKSAAFLASVEAFLVPGYLAGRHLSLWLAPRLAGIPRRAALTARRVPLSLAADSKLNRLLDGSISLSPLYPNLTIDLPLRRTELQDARTVCASVRRPAELSHDASAPSSSQQHRFPEPWTVPYGQACTHPHNHPVSEASTVLSVADL